MGNYKKSLPYLVLGPVFLFILVFTIYPLITSVYHSFTQWDGMSAGQWIGLQNYIEIFTDPQFYRLLLNNVIIFLSIPVQVLIGLILTFLLYEKVAGWRFFRSVYFMPYILSSVIVGFLFSIFFGYDGPINIVLRALGLDFLAVEWLASGPTGMFVIVICIIWASFGQATLIFLSGMSTISPSVFEQALIDGAGWWKRLFYVVLPMLIRYIEFFTVISIIWSFTGTFSFIYSITNGGPGYETTPVDYMIYLKAFTDISGDSMGYACALSMILFVLVLVISKVEMKITERMDDWCE